MEGEHFRPRNSHRLSNSGVGRCHNAPCPFSRLLQVTAYVELDHPHIRPLSAYSSTCAIILLESQKKKITTTTTTKQITRTKTKLVLRLVSALQKKVIIGLPLLLLLLATITKRHTVLPPRVVHFTTLGSFISPHQST